ncbi:phosphoribosyltransferase family protein [Actinokineospora spheciospongiae]|uniref:phosphoribosyltransferase family protein n=1 Tax=Actinokineospora spheciospongiae TaxID=909613 RepID=UPI000D9A61E7|nr:phosphoribosyltransferase family protein [Actinokineospora spheciospongiae]PWW59477.1 adenine phosphoribosyltransferase [Actinokineospora spheciospongiae]
MKADSSRRRLVERLRGSFAWRGDRTDDRSRADVTGWWHDPGLLAELGPGLADSFREEAPTVVIGVESRGSLLGPLVALDLGVGFVEVRKDRSPLADSDAWLRRTTPPDYRDRHLGLGFPRRLLSGSDRVLLVDDWIDTGGQALGALGLVEDSGASWVGASVIVDSLESSEIRRRLNVRSLVRQRDLP